jgi:hypothetical protein
MSIPGSKYSPAHLACALALLLSLSPARGNAAEKPADTSDSTTLAVCTFTLGATVPAFAVNGGAGDVTVSTQDGCAWTSTGGAAWVTITSASPQTGNGAVSYTVAPNTAPLLRTATLTIAGKPYRVTQAPCTFTFDATATALPPAGGSGSVAVTTGDACPWTSTSSVPWATITSPSPRRGTARPASACYRTRRRRYGSPR